MHGPTHPLRGVVAGVAGALIVLLLGMALPALSGPGLASAGPSDATVPETGRRRSSRT